ncbi:MAG: hypothetical protein IAG13_09685 [Deltaproteobacteria bacterium]|nr:hypothetical protein [Nannocystaceae bacterium]
MARLVATLCCGAGLLACDPVADELPVCDPLVAEQQPTALHVIIAAGRAADGTLFVVDEDAERGRPRVFVSEGDGIRRVEVAGEGHGSDASGESWSFGVVAHAPPFTLMVTRMAEEIRMGVVVGDANIEEFEIGEVGEELTAVAADDVLGLPTYGIVTTIVPEYLARTDGGRTVAVLRPEPAESYDDFRLFFGSDELVEHAIGAFARERDGGTTTLEFDVGPGDPGVAHFPTPSSPELPDTLTLDGVTEELFTIDAGALDGAVFRCLAG